MRWPAGLLTNRPEHCLTLPISPFLDMSWIRSNWSDAFSLILKTHLH
jgi:hypothetical protein